MIKKITKTKITQICSECNETNIITIDNLIIGTDTDKNIIVLPKCSCNTNAQEFLTRTLDNWGEQARIVNSLHYFLHKKGKVNPKIKDKFDKEKEEDKPKNKVDMASWTAQDSLENKGGFVND